MREETLTDWIGITVDTTDTLTALVCQQMAATIGTPTPCGEDALPPLWHWLFFHAVTEAARLDDDGHPQRGEFMPPVPLPRRMWAGGRLRFFKPIGLGVSVRRHSRITQVLQKKGKSGKLCFVTVLHSFFDNQSTLLMEEEHDIVYREAPVSEPMTRDERDSLRPLIRASAVLSEQLSDTRLLITPSVGVLFRYSALTFNSHRIHYDRDYCQSVEHYAGLVVHGPLTATLMAGFAQTLLKEPLSRFDFRALLPLLDIETFTIDAQKSSEGVELFARKNDGSIAMQASAVA